MTVQGPAPEVEPVRETVMRVYTDRGPIDYRPTSFDIGPDGSIVLKEQTETEEFRLDPVSGQRARGVIVRLLAVIGPSGMLRAETVEEGAPFRPEKP